MSSETEVKVIPGLFKITLGIILGIAGLKFGPTGFIFVVAGTASFLVGMSDLGINSQARK